MSQREEDPYLQISNLAQIHYRIPITQLKTSTNKFYAGTHWSKRKEFKDSVLGYAKEFCRPIQSVESYPVQILYKFIFSSRALDTLNCAIMAKCFEDSLCALKVIKDDSPKYVARSIIEVVMVPKKKNKKKGNDLGPQKVEKDEDWLEITIQSICQN